MGMLLQRNRKRHSPEVEEVEKTSEIEEIEETSETSEIEEIEETSEIEEIEEVEKVVSDIQPKEVTTSEVEKTDEKPKRKPRTKKA